jgi:hypothetical protein
LKTDIEKEKILSITYSFLSGVVGIIKEDGFIGGTKTNKEKGFSVKFNHWFNY